MALSLAAQDGNVLEVRRLVEHGGDVNVQDYYGRSPLHSAARGGHVEVARTLVQLAADVHAVNVRGTTPLHLASTAAVVTLLLEAGADLHRRDHNGNTPLFAAIHLGHAPAVTALVQAGACQASDGEWWTTLVVGALTGDEAALAELIAARGELTQRMNENGQLARTAVQLAELSTDDHREEVLAALTVPQQ